jgi:hypothetical protein
LKGTNCAIHEGFPREQIDVLDEKKQRSDTVAALLALILRL